MNSRPQVLFVSHGGGPMPLLGESGHTQMVECLQTIAHKLRKPSAVLVVSAHWEEATATITAIDQPALIYDYYGFPAESYQIQYPCNGNPQLAKQIYHALNRAGLEARLDSRRGLDHGVFVPLKILYPDAHIPCVQLSLISDLDPAKHIAMGRALGELNVDNLLVIGSGFSFHNMKAFFAPQSDESRLLNEQFEFWIKEVCSNTELSEIQRAQRLCDWEAAPGARYCHPREEHLLPLHFCYGAANRPCSEFYELQILNKKSCMVLWQ